MSKAFEDVMAERRRQVEAEGFDVAHDDGHGEGELALAGSCYARYAATRNPVGPYGYPGGPIPKDWPWSINWWKPTEKRRDLVKAAALLLAEIERLDRAAAPTIPPENDTPVRCQECNWCGRADELGPEGECGADLNCNGRPTEITEPTGLIQAWQDSEGMVAGKQLADAGLIAPRPSTANEAGALDMEPGDAVWDLTEAGEAVLNAAKAEA